MMISQIARALLALALLAFPVAASAQAVGDGFVRLGRTRIAFADEGALKANGMVIPGADYDTDPAITATVEAGVFVAGDFALAVSGSFPVESDNIGAGTLDGVGNLGSDKFSYFTGTAQYHFNRGGRVVPYVGGGIAYQATWDSDDGLVTDLDIGDGHGPVIQAGVEFMVSDRFGIYADAKKAWLKNKARGMLGPDVITAKPELDPFILQAGISYHF